MKITSIDVFLVTIGQPSVPGSPWNPVVVRINKMCIRDRCTA